MSLGLVSPILNRGVRSQWVSTLPASSKMLTIDAAGDVSYTDIPTAAWGSITGTLSSQTDLQNALNAKLSLTGGTVTGQLTNALGTITSSTPLTLTQTWNNAAVTFTGALVNVTDTASASGSLLMDLQVGGSSKFSVDKRGMITTATGTVPSAGGIGTDKLCLQFIYANYGIGVNGNGRPVVVVNSSQEQTLGLNTIVGSAGLYGWSTGTQANQSATYDLALFRDAANTLAQRNSTNAQAYRIYNTYTDASNYERGKFAWESNVLRIGTEKGGTGSARAVEIQTDGTTRLTVASTGAVSTATAFTVNNAAGIYETGSGRTVAFTSNFSANTPGIGTTSNHDFCVYTNGANERLRISATGLLTIADASNIAVGTTTGTKIGTATTQKIGFYDKTPVVQPAAVADATDAASVITQLNLLLSRMRDLGLIAT